MNAESIAGGGGAVGVVLAVLLMLRQHFTAAEKRADAQAEAQNKREDRYVAASEANAKATADLAVSLSGIAAEIRELRTLDRGTPPPAAASIARLRTGREGG
jgi:NAD dependent epimerase/dehydratase family enzyme